MGNIRTVMPGGQVGGTGVRYGTASPRDRDM